MLRREPPRREVRRLTLAGHGGSHGAGLGQIRSAHSVRDEAIQHERRTEFVDEGDDCLVGRDTKLLLKKQFVKSTILEGAVTVARLSQGRH